MPPAIIFRIVTGVAGLLFAALLAWTVKDRFHQKGLADAAGRCAVAASSEAAPLEDCLKPVAARVQADRQNVVCETALLPSLRPESRFRVLNSCGEGVKRLVAERDAAQAGQSDALRLLDEAQAGSLAAVSRAEARAGKIEERKTRASTAIAAAPRGAGGSIACDAACLRQLAE